jgi:transcriptional regulator
MYQPRQFREDDPQVLRAFIARHPLGALVASTADGLTASHIPMFWRAQGAPAGVLAGHIAKANTLWQNLAPDAAVLVIFSGANHYITPSWYPAKKIDGRVVPTWNYSVVHAHGSIRFFQDAAVALEKVRALTELQEAARRAPWAVSDAPPDYLQATLRQIVPFEIALTRLQGKFKASQHRPADERAAVTAALRAEGLEEQSITELVRPPGVPP